MIDIRDKKECCGCNACGDVCPTQAVSFVVDEEGFLYPKVDQARCTNCRMCEKVCPQLRTDSLKQNEFSEPKCYAAVHKNLAIRFDSTSGGAFSACANVVYRQGGFVGGAVWTNDFHITQYISDNKGDLPRLRSSKYAQSDARGFYKAVKDAVLSGKPVLVCGTPCQMGALRLFLGRPYDNLIVMDFICRGNNSPLVFRKYLDWQEMQTGDKVVYVKPKNKELGWRQLTTKLVFNNGAVIYDTIETSNFTKGYLQTNAYCRPSCYDCRFKGLPRMSDITVADLWGGEGLLPKEFDLDIGTSLVMVSNGKGAVLWNQASKSMLVKEFPWNQALQGNPMLAASLPPPKCDRQDFFKVLGRDGFAGVVAKYISPMENVRTKSALKRFLKWRKSFSRFLRHHWRSPQTIFRLVRDNGFVDVLRLRYKLITHPKTHLEIEGTLDLRARLTLGIGYFKKPIAQTALAVRKGGLLSTSGRESFFMYGADIEIFPGGKLEIGSDCGFNLGATIVCGCHIKIGNGVKGGRHVTIRDNNGSHWINLPGYKDMKPIEIGDHVWLCEGCTIMPGVKIGAGAIVGAKAVVFNNVPANAMVIGNPAQVVCDDVEWKY